MQLAEPNLALFDHRVGVGHLRFAAAQRLHLGAGEDDPRLHLLDPLEFVAGAAVGDHVARGGSAFLLHLLGHQAGSPAGSSSALPRGASTPATRADIGSPRLTRAPEPRPTSATSERSSS